MAKIINTVSNIKLLIVGKGDGYGLEILNLAKTLGIEDKLVFTNWLSKEEMLIAYQICDVVVVPSIYLDPFPTVNLEAMASGLPVVGTCFGGTKELVLDNQTGFIVNPLNVDQLAEKILTLLKDGSLAKKFGEAGKRRINDYFTLTQQVKKIEKYYS